MPSVTFTIRVAPKAPLPVPKVQVGLDTDGDHDVAAAEFKVATPVGNDTFQCTFPNVPSTTGRWWVVVVRAATNSTYAIAVTADGANVLPGGASGVVYPQPPGHTSGQLA